MMLKLAIFILSFHVCIGTEYNLSICALFQDEAKYLKEWIDFHKEKGVEHFYLYNNLSTDNYKNVLNPYIQSGEVDLYDWPFYSEDGSWIPFQISSYNDCLSKANSKWIAFLDLDEFLFSPMNNDLKQLLPYYEAFPAICVNWVMYGTSYIDCSSKDKILPYLTLRSSFDYGGNKITKSIVQTKKAIQCLNPHVFQFKNNELAVNELFEKVPLGGTTACNVNILRINHYWCRDEWFFNNVKIPRRIKYGDTYDEIKQIANNLNEVYDPILAN